MTPENQLRKAYRARWNQTKRACNAMLTLLKACDPDKVDGVTINDMREHTQDINHCLHEFNAYRNAYGTITGKRVAPLSNPGDLR